MTLEEYFELKHAQNCHLKTKFAAEAEAYATYARCVGLKGNWKARQQSMNLYICRACGYLHIGHGKLRDYKSRARQLSRTASA